MAGGRPSKRTGSHRFLRSFIPFFAVMGIGAAAGLAAQSAEIGMGVGSAGLVVLLFLDLGFRYAARGATFEWALAHEKSERARERGRAAAALRKHPFGDDPGRNLDAVDALLRLQVDPSARVRVMAMQGLWRHAREIPESRRLGVLDAVLAAHDSDERRIQSLGTSALREMLPTVPPERRGEVFARLWRMTNDNDAAEAGAAVLLVAEFIEGVPPDSCGPLARKLMELCKEKDTNLRRRAAAALGTLGPRIPESDQSAAFALLQSLCADRGMMVGGRAVEGIAAWGSQAEGPRAAEAFEWVSSIADGRRGGDRAAADRALLWFGAKLPTAVRAARTDAIVRQLQSREPQALAYGLFAARSMGQVVPEERREEVLALLRAAKERAPDARLLASAQEALASFEAREGARRRTRTVLDMVSK